MLCAILRTLKIGPFLWTTGFSGFSNPVTMTDRFLFHVYEPDLGSTKEGSFRSEVHPFGLTIRNAEFVFS
ncbi:hypothetical protein BUQ74_09430 [Leptospira weilii serovar Heyan]|nr:hypothetical protein BUQ74_09430 [Leptospira weilii serovar Heyan]